MKKYLTSEITRKMQTKSTMRNHLMHITETVVKKITSVDEDAEKWKTSHIADGTV